MMSKIQIAIAEDHTLLRETIVQLLNQNNQMEVVVSVPNGLALLTELAGKKIDILILDLNMPIMNGHEAIIAVKKYFPKIKIVIYSGQDSHYFITKMLSKGARAFISKRADSSVLEEAIYHLKNNHYFLKNIVEKEIMSESRFEFIGKGKYLKGEPLSRKEIEVVKLICLQKNITQMAEELGVVKKTIHDRRSSILKKTGAINSVGIFEYALRYGYYELV